MKIKELKIRADILQNKKLNNIYNQFGKLLTELKKRELSDDIIITINDEIDQVNFISDSKKELSKQLKKTQSKVVELIEKELKLVTKNHYKYTWLPLGMAVFGIPIGVLLGTSIGNMGLLGIGLPIGMTIGIAVGSAKDKKANKEGRQLDLEIKH